MKKTLLTLTLTGALAMTACAAKPDMTTATTAPSPTISATGFPDQLPMETGIIPQLENGVEQMIDGLTGQPTAGPTAIPQATGVTSMDKARSVVEQLEEELERLSEVDDAEVVIAGNRAAVALEFDDQYHGGIDERLRSIVQERIDSVITGVDDVFITADTALMKEVETLGERLGTMSDMSALRSDLDAIIRRIGGE